MKVDGGAAKASRGTWILVANSGEEYDPVRISASERVNQAYVYRYSGPSSRGKQLLSMRV